MLYSVWGEKSMLQGRMCTAKSSSQDPFSSSLTYTEVIAQIRACEKSSEWSIFFLSCLFSTLCPVLFWNSTLVSSEREHMAFLIKACDFLTYNWIIHSNYCEAFQMKGFPGLKHCSFVLHLIGIVRLCNTDLLRSFWRVLCSILTCWGKEGFSALAGVDVPWQACVWIR